MNLNVSPATYGSIPRSARSGRNFSAICAAAAAIALLAALPARAAPDDLVPRSSGFYDALAILAADHYLAPGAPDAVDLLSPSAPLRTRAEFAILVNGVTGAVDGARARAAIGFLRNGLAGDTGSGPDTQRITEPDPASSALAVSGNVIAEAGTRHDGSHKSIADLYGEARALGSDGRFSYTAGVSNTGRFWRDHQSYATSAPGQDRGDRPDALNGLQEGYASYLGHHDLRITTGWLQERWGSAYRGDLLISDNTPPRPTIQIEFPFSLGATFGRSNHFLQYQQVYSNAGHTVTMGARRIEHPIGDRVDLSIEEAYVAKRLRNPSALVLPFYAYQKLSIHEKGNPNAEPAEFNYMANLGLTFRPDPADPYQRLYLQFALDDIQAPHGLGQGNRTPRKIAYLVGAAGRLKSTGTDGVVEYMHSDVNTYTKNQVGVESLGWFYDGLPLGHPSGPNGNEIFGRLGQKIGARSYFSVEARRRVRVSDAFPAPDVRSVDAAFTYHLNATSSVGLRYFDFSEDPLIAPGVDPYFPGGDNYGARIRRKVAAVDYQIFF